jgi:MoaA/NifB/PqqE/SkfB family radical SAM enzyme
MKRQFVVRPESFGATVYDWQSLSYFFVDQMQLARLANLFKLPIGAFPSPTGLGLRRSDLSNGQLIELVSSSPSAEVSLTAVRGPLPNDTLAAPIRVYLEVTTRCNGRCQYCLNDSRTARPGELSRSELLRTIRNMGQDGVLEVRLTGGEPTLRHDLPDLARQVQESGMALSINSNLLCGKRTLKQLVSLHPSLLITSLDAAEEPHAKHRGPGFRQIAQNVERLREAEIPVRVNCVMSRDTLPQIEPFVDRFAPLGCGFCFILVRPVGRAQDNFNPPPLEDLIAAVESIENKRKAYPGVYFSTSFHVVMERELVIGGVELTGCNAIQKSFNVNSDGAVLPCAFLYELSVRRFTLGNIRDADYSVLPIWRSSQLLRRLRRRSAGCNKRCIGCDRFKRDCLGTCVFMELYSELSGRPDPYCSKSAPLHWLPACPGK